VKALTSLHDFASLGNGKVSRELIGWIFPEKFIFQSLKDRTAQVNRVASIISKKERVRAENSILPSLPAPVNPNLIILILA